MDDPIIVTGKNVILPYEDYAALNHFNERAQMKLRQLESTEFEDFGGLGTGNDTASRAAYVRLLKWLLDKSLLGQS